MRYTITELGKAILFLEILKDRFSFDTETNQLRWDGQQIEIISFCDKENSAVIDMRKWSKNDIDMFWEEFTKKLETTKLLIAHNIVFDMKALMRYNIHIPEHIKLYCTMVAHHLLDENSSNSLKHLAATELGIHDITKWRDVDKNSSKYLDYALKDAEWTWKLANLFLPRLHEEGLIKLMFDIEMPFVRCQVEMETTGIQIDRDVVTQTTKELDKEKEELNIKLHNSIDESYEIQFDLFGNSTIKSKLNFNSSKDLGDILFKRLKLEPVETTPGGQPSVGRKTIEALKSSHEFVMLLYKYKVCQKLLSAFFEPLPGFIDSDGKVRPNYRSTGTKTGRLSCHEPNLQQLPKINKEFPIDTRKCFVAKKGYQMIACDYSGQELRVLAEITKEPALIDTFEKGKDLHLSTANDFFDLNIPEDELFITNANFKKHKERYYDERNKAKIINFGMAYGKGAYGFSKDFGISEAEAETILEKYFAALPAVRESINRTHSEVKRSGFVTSLTGRRRRFQYREVDGNRFYPKACFRQAFNFLIQGYSADMIRIAAIKCRELSLKNPDWDLRMLMTVHDEIVFECKKEYSEVASKAIKDTFESAVKLVVPVKADVDIGNSYSDVK